MKLVDVRKLVVGVALGLAILVIGAADASAQSRWETRQERIERERWERQQERERQRQRRLRNRRQTLRDSRVGRQTERRINSSTFATGYQQGYLAGQYDSRRGRYNQSNVYRDSGFTPNAGDPTSYDYIYRQGYLEGYNDGFYGRRNY